MSPCILSYSEHQCLWTIEKALVYSYTFGTRTTVIDFGFRGSRVVIAEQYNWIPYAMLENWSTTSMTECSGRTYLDYRLSYRVMGTRYHHEIMRAASFLRSCIPQLRRLCCSDAGPPLQSPPSVA